MFDLFRSRAKAVRYLLGAILMLVALSMVVTLIPGFMGSSYSTDDNIIAEIGGEVLSARDVQINIQQQLRNNAFPREMAHTYVPMIINQMVSDRAVAYEAERLGFLVTDAEVARAVQTMIPQLFQGGEFVGQEVYAQYLSQMNLTIPEFEGNVRKQMLLLKLQNMALEGEVVTDEQIEAEFRKANEMVQIDYITIAPSNYRSQVRITQEDIRAHYETNKSTFQVGEKRDAQILVVDETEVAKTVKASDEELRRLYQSNTDRYRTPERVHARHILLKTTGSSEAQVAEAKAKAGDLLKQLKAGADFADLAKEHSDDTGSAVQGGDLSWITRGQTVPKFEQAAFSLEPNQLSDVIETEYGFHILEVLEKERAQLQDFEDVKEQLAEENNRQIVFDRIQQLADQAYARLAENPSQGEAIANELGITIFNVGQVGATDPIPEAAASPEMQNAIRSLAQGGVSQIYDLGGNRLGIATVTQVYPPRPAELSEVEATIRERLLTQRTQQIVEEKRTQLREELPNAGEDLEKLARSLDLKVVSADPFSRAGTVSGLGAAAYMEAAFNAPEGSLVGPIAAMGQTAVCKIVKKIPADMTRLASERDAIQNQLRQQKARERQELFADGVLNQLIEAGDVKLNDRGIQRLISVYGS